MSDYSDIYEINNMSKIVPYQEQIKIIGNQLIDMRNHYKNEAGEMLIKTYHSMGQAINQLPDKYSAVKELHAYTGINERILYYAAVFYDKFPNLEEVPLNYSWTKIVAELLPNLNEPKQIEEKTFLPKPQVKLKLCKTCYKNNLDLLDLSI